MRLQGKKVALPIGGWEAICTEEMGSYVVRFVGNDEPRSPLGGEIVKMGVSETLKLCLYVASRYDPGTDFGNCHFKFSGFPVPPTEVIGCAALTVDDVLNFREMIGSIDTLSLQA